MGLMTKKAALCVLLACSMAGACANEDSLVTVSFPMTKPCKADFEYYVEAIRTLTNPSLRIVEFTESFRHLDSIIGYGELSSSIHSMEDLRQMIDAVMMRCGPSASSTFALGSTGVLSYEVESHRDGGYKNISLQLDGSRVIIFSSDPMFQDWAVWKKTEN